MEVLNSLPEWGRFAAIVGVPCLCFIAFLVFCGLIIWKVLKPLGDKLIDGMINNIGERLEVLAVDLKRVEGLLNRIVGNHESQHHD